MDKNNYQLSRSEIEEAIFDKYVTYHYSTEELKNNAKSHRDSILEKHKKDFFYLNKNYGPYITPSNNVLDVGFGYGSFTNFCYQQGVKKYTGIEVSSEQKELIKYIFPNYNFVIQDAFAFLKENNIKYDVIFMSHVMEHFTLEDQYTLLNLISDNLSEDGVFINTMPNAEAIFTATASRYCDITHKMLHTPASFTQLLNLIGFQNIEHKNMHVGKNFFEIAINNSALYLTKTWMKALGYGPPKIHTNSILSICKNK